MANLKKPEKEKIKRYCVSLREEEVKHIQKITGLKNAGLTVNLRALIEMLKKATIN